MNDTHNESGHTTAKKEAYPNNGALKDLNNIYTINSAGRQEDEEDDSQ
jgi:hypothetical protein